MITNILKCSFSATSKPIYQRLQKLIELCQVVATVTDKVWHFFSQSPKDSKANNFDKLIVYFVKKYQNVLAYIQQSFTFDRTLKKQLLLKVHS